MKRIDMIGEKWGRLTVVADAGTNKNGQGVWECLCECGNKTVVLRRKLVTGDTKSCGCLSKELRKNLKTTHGLSESSEYRTWRHIINRCTNKNTSAYHNYGGRGIKVCNEWLESFENFYADMGEKPTGGSIERIDNNKGYSKDNCVWAGAKAQARNRRSNKLISYGGVVKPLYEWAELLNITYAALQRRLAIGWDVERAFTQPMRSRENG